MKESALIEQKEVKLVEQAVLKKDAPKVDQSFIDISTYNGDDTGKYKWSQAFNEVVVQVDLPKGVKKQDLVIEIKPHHLKVSLKG